MKKAAILACGVALGLSPLSVLAANSPAGTTEEEVYDRVVDRASAETQMEAERDLADLIKKYQNSPREAALQLRLGALRLEIAQTLFRVSYGPSETDLKKRYENVLARSVVAFTRVVSAYPGSAEAPRALFLRGRAYRELGFPGLALQDLEKFVKLFPKREETALASLGIADLRLVKRDYARALEVLAPMSQSSKHAYFAAAVQKSAWAHHAIGRSDLALRDLQTLSSFFAAKEKAGTLTSGERVIREALIPEVAPIAFAAYRDQKGKLSLERVNALFRSFDSGEGYNLMNARMADHLRADDRAEDLRNWKGIVLRNDPARKENLGILIGIFQYELERESFGEAVKVGQEIAGILASEKATEENADQVKEAQTLLVKTAEQLTRRVADYKKSAQSTSAEKNLVALLPQLDRALSPTDARRFVVRWNLAETLFALERFDAATVQYRWLQQNWNEDARLKFTANDAGLKAISSRYESLKADGLVPQDLVAGSAKKASKGALASIREWIQWIDALKERREDLNRFAFEANRTLYVAGSIDEAMERSRAFSLSQPSSEVAMPSAMLVMDTLIARKDWNRVEAQANEFASVKGWKNDQFASRMRERASSARFGMVKASFEKKAYGEAIKNAEIYLDRYENGPFAIDALGIACNSQMALGQMDQAVGCFNQVAKQARDPKVALQAARTVAQIEDDRYHFVPAIEAYERYLKVGGKLVTAKEELAVRRRLLQLSLASGDLNRLRSISNAKKNCVKELREECQTNLAVLTLLEKSDSPKETERAIRNAETGPKAYRAIWATIALDNWSYLGHDDIDSILATLSKAWKETDATVRYMLVPRLTASLPALLKHGRESLERREMTADEASVLNRMKAIADWEKRAMKATALPLNSVQLAVYSELELAYRHLAEDIRKIEAQKGASKSQIAEHQSVVGKMSAPFALKARKLRDQALALDLKKSGFDSNEVDSLWDQSTPSARSAALRIEWRKALKEGQWNRVAFFTTEASDLKELSPNWVKAARAVSLAESGAVAEAKLLFTDACRGTTLPKLREACRAVKGREGV